MIDIRDINSEKEIEYKIAMAPAYYLPNAYFIFRSISEQIVLTVTGNTFTSTSLLTIDEINHIEKHYPFLDCVNYKVKSK